MEVPLAEASTESRASQGQHQIAILVKAYGRQMSMHCNLHMCIALEVAHDFSVFLFVAL